MKVADISQIKALGASKPPEPGRTPAAADAGDRVSTDDSAKVAAAIAAASQSAGAGRAARLQAIEAAVRDGTYKPDPNRIAQEILDEAEVAARLQALFTR